MPRLQSRVEDLIFLQKTYDLIEKKSIICHHLVSRPHSKYYHFLKMKGSTLLQPMMDELGLTKPYHHKSQRQGSVSENYKENYELIDIF